MTGPAVEVAVDDGRRARLAALQRDPYPTYERAREQQGLMFLPELDAWLVSRYADVQDVLRRPEDFSSANALSVPSGSAVTSPVEGLGGRSTVVTSDRAEHKCLRQPITRGLSSSRTASVGAVAARRAQDLVESFASHGRVELVRQYATQLPGTVIGELLGLDPSDVPRAIAGTHGAEDLALERLDAAGRMRATGAVLALQQVLDRLVSRPQGRNADLTSDLVKALAPLPMERTTEVRRVLVSHLQTILSASQLPTSAIIASAVLHLAQHRSQWELLRSDPALIPAAVEELLRYDTPSHGFGRIATRTVSIAGVDLPAGAQLFVAFGSANRDAAVFDQPNVLDITRPPPRHLSFGYGIHTCPGARLARQQLRVTLETLLTSLPELRLAPDHDITMLPTLTHRSPQRLDVTW